MACLRCLSAPSASLVLARFQSAPVAGDRPHLPPTSRSLLTHLSPAEDPHTFLLTRCYDAQRAPLRKRHVESASEPGWHGNTRSSPLRRSGAAASHRGGPLPGGTG